MALQMKFFIVPIRGVEEAEAEINSFLRTVRVVNLQREFVAQGENSFWSMAVEYLANGSGDTNEKSGNKKRSRIDYKKILAPEAFAIFAKLRDWRKTKAEQEAVPVYTIFTNEQLSQVAEKNITTKAGLEQIEGLGEGRVKKYGNEVIDIVMQQLQEISDEKDERDLPTDPHL